MNELEATRVKLKCLEMVEGTDLDWWEVIRHKPTKERIKSGLVDYYPEHIELVLGILEGKLVWEGDELYCNDIKYTISEKDRGFRFTNISWNPPKPKTVMVELPYQSVVNAVAKEQVDYSGYFSACRKALEEMK